MDRPIMFRRVYSRIRTLSCLLCLIVLVGTHLPSAECSVMSMGCRSFSGDAYLDLSGPRTSVIAADFGLCDAGAVDVPEGSTAHVTLLLMAYGSGTVEDVPVGPPFSSNPWAYLNGSIGLDVYLPVGFTGDFLTVTGPATGYGDVALYQDSGTTGFDFSGSGTGQASFYREESFDGKVYYALSSAEATVTNLPEPSSCLLLLSGVMTLASAKAILRRRSVPYGGSR